MIDFDHLLAATLEARRSKQAWQDLSLRERAFAALALRQEQWLAEDELTPAAARDLLGPALLELLPAVESALLQ